MKGDEAEARRFENYNPRNLPDVLALGSAIDFHNLIGEKEKVERFCHLKAYLRTAVELLPFLRLRVPAGDDLSAGITSVEMSGRNVTEVATTLETDYSISVRPMPMLGINGLRISTSICTTVKEINLLLEALDRIHQG